MTRELHPASGPSDRELCPTVASTCHQKATQTQACEGVEPQQGGGASKHGPHPFPADTALPGGLLVLQPLDLLRHTHTHIISAFLNAGLVPGRYSSLRHVQFPLCHKQQSTYRHLNPCAIAMVYSPSLSLGSSLGSLCMQRGTVGSEIGRAHV